MWIVLQGGRCFQITITFFAPKGKVVQVLSSYATRIKLGDDI